MFSISLLDNKIIHKIANKLLLDNDDMQVYIEFDYKNKTCFK